MNSNFKLIVPIAALILFIGLIIGIVLCTGDDSTQSEITTTDGPIVTHPQTPSQSPNQTPTTTQKPTPNPTPSQPPIYTPQETQKWSPDSDHTTTYIVPTITDEQILPDSNISETNVSNDISITASPGEFEPASFVVHTEKDIESIQIDTTNLTGPGGSIPADAIDISVVKCWYQAGESIHNEGVRLLTPELLLKDDALVKVEDEENYLKVDDNYIWISSPEGIPDIPVNAKSDEFPVRDSDVLEPVNLTADSNKQFWITVKVPEDSSEGVYAGTIELTNPTGLIGQLKLSVNVLPIDLSEPLLTYSIFYHGRMKDTIPQGEITDAIKSETQYRAEIKDLYDHGVTNPTVNPLMQNEELARAFTIRQETGIDSNTAFFYNFQKNGYFQLVVDRVPRVLELAQTFGIDDAYFYGEDEAKDEELLAERAAWERIHKMGGKIFASGYTAAWWPPGHFVWVGDILDLLICAGEPSADEAADWHSQGHKIFCYANPQGGEERPEKYRRNFGLLLWQQDYDGAMTYAYQGDNGNPWNDFDPDGPGGSYYYRDHHFAYPTFDGIIDTIQWEGFREGVDDVRYLTTLLDTIEEVRGTQDVISVEEWLAELKKSDLETRNLDNIRSEIIDHIISLQAASSTS